MRITDRGKWHVLAQPLDSTTPCNEAVPAGAPRRALELVDSGSRCRAQGCIDARNKARGLT